MKTFSCLVVALFFGMTASSQAATRVEQKSLSVVPGEVVHVVAHTKKSTTCVGVVGSNKVKVAVKDGSTVTYAFTVASSAKASKHKLTITCDGEKAAQVSIRVKTSKSASKNAGITKELLAFTASDVAGQRLSFDGVLSSEGTMTDEEEAAYIQWLVDTIDENDPTYLEEKAAIEQAAASVSDDDPTYLEEKAYIERIVAGADQ